ncbi:MAG: hypothetical protein QOJ81_1587, partial [Chloroflexota bacterium]|nr:hypothetical protein [Chloroflexota bacterium]
MDRRSTRVNRIVAAAFALGLLALQPATLVLAESPLPSASPQANTDITIEARALLGGHVRPGAWTAIAVHVTNSGPSIDGELRIGSAQGTTSQYGLEIQLPTDANKEVTLYAQTQIFGSRINVELVSGDQVIASQQVQIRSHDAYSPIVAVIAERPEGLLPQINAALVNPNFTTPTVITLTAADLPPRVEAWAAIDRLVWQDVDAALLSDAQTEALRLWLGAGGQLVIVGGTTGRGTLTGFDVPDADLLPFEPTGTIDVAASDLVPLVGALPADAATTPAVGGLLRRGTILARSGDDVIAAQQPYGRGQVTLIGFNPAERWLAGGATASALWHRLLPPVTGQALNPLQLPDDSQIVYALQNVPQVALPPIEQLFVLLVAYIALIGPINYIVLRRLDKREWAWITIPALVVVFAVGSYGLGASLKGSDVIVNEVGVIRASQGSGRGIGQIYVGIYSPTRRSFQVSIQGGALLSNPISQVQQTGSEQPLDVLFGSSASHLRNFEVGFGVVRGFRAEAPADAPQIESDLHLASGRLQGTLTNRSDSTLENIAIVFGGGVAVLDSLEAGKSSTIDIDTTTGNQFGYALSEQIFGSSFPRDAATARAVYTRRAVIDQLFNYGSVPSADAPLLLAWHSGSVVDVDLAGETPNRVGDALYMISLGVSLDANQVFADQAMKRTIIATDASQAWGDSGSLNLSRGTMTIENRPISFSGTFTATALEIALTQGEQTSLAGKGSIVEPLPADQQPDQDDPVSNSSAGPTPSPDPNITPDPNATPIPPVKPGVPGGPDVPGQMPFGLPALQL